MNGADIVCDDYLNIDPRILFYKENIDMNIENYIRSSLSKVIKVKSIEVDDVKLKGGYISDVLSLRITNELGEVIECVLKLENTHETPLSVMATALGLYDRENYFYDTISKYVPVNIPNFYGLIKDEQFFNTENNETKFSFFFLSVIVNFILNIKLLYLISFTFFNYKTN